VGDAMIDQGMQSRIKKKHLQKTLGCRIPFLRGPDFRVKNKGNNGEFQDK
jgi:hypothetical protein